MEHTCVFSPDRLNGYGSCENPATHQMFIKSQGNPDDKGNYHWICDDCLPEAIRWWKECEQIVEF